jgi:hypothetical protein
MSVYSFSLDSFPPSSGYFPLSVPFARLTSLAGVAQAAEAREALRNMGKSPFTADSPLQRSPPPLPPRNLSLIRRFHSRYVQRCHDEIIAERAAEAAINCYTKSPSNIQEHEEQYQVNMIFHDSLANCEYFRVIGDYEENEESEAEEEEEEALHKQRNTKEFTRKMEEILENQNEEVSALHDHFVPHSSTEVSSFVSSEDISTLSCSIQVDQAEFSHSNLYQTMDENPENLLLNESELINHELDDLSDPDDGLSQFSDDEQLIAINLSLQHKYSKESPKFDHDQDLVILSPKTLAEAVKLSKQQSNEKEENVQGNLLADSDEDYELL